MTSMEPPESLLTQLDRVAPPRPWVVADDRSASLVTETCSMSPLDSAHSTDLPTGVPIRFVPSGTSSELPLRVRIFEPSAATATPQTLATFTAAGETTHELVLRLDAGEKTLVLDGAPGAVLAEPGWLDIDICIASGSTGVTVAHRGTVVSKVAHLPTPFELTLGTDAFDTDTDTGLVPTIALARTQAGETLSRDSALRYLCTVRERLDQELAGWRTPNDALDTARPLDVFAGRREVRRASAQPTGRVEILGFLSEGWQRRLRADEWAYADTKGSPVNAAELDAYGRAGGLIAYVYDRRWEMPAADEKATTANLNPGSAPEVYSGSRDSWVAGMRNTETMLYQFATVWYLGRQTRGTDPAEATGTLAAALDQLWHPTHAFHLDVVQILARAIGRYRFSDPEYTDRAPLVLAELRDRLGELGVASRPVVLS